MLRRKASEGSVVANVIQLVLTGSVSKAGALEAAQFSRVLCSGSHVKLSPRDDCSLTGR